MRIGSWSGRLVPSRRGATSASSAEYGIMSVEATCSESSYTVMSVVLFSILEVTAITSCPLFWLNVFLLFRFCQFDKKCCQWIGWCRVRVVPFKYKSNKFFPFRWRQTLYSCLIGRDILILAHKVVPSFLVYPNALQLTPGHFQTV